MRTCKRMHYFKLAGLMLGIFGVLDCYAGLYNVNAVLGVSLG